jgi:steroid delta-isomerase-like uncharacterized protein
MSSDHYLRLLSRHLEAENAHLLPETLATLSADCVFDDVALGRRFEAHLGAASYYRMWWDAFSVAVSPEELHLSGDVAVAETTWRGTHVGPFLGLPPTGRSIEVPVIVVVELRDGLMAGERLYWDRGTLATQLGARVEEFTCTPS